MWISSAATPFASLMTKRSYPYACVSCVWKRNQRSKGWWRGDSMGSQLTLGCRRFLRERTAPACGHLYGDEGCPTLISVRNRQFFGGVERDDGGTVGRQHDLLFDTGGGDTIAGRAVGLDGEHHARPQLERVGK
jgi:hypothetical protein